MFKNLFKKNNNNINSTAFKVEILVASLLIHAAKMDQNYSVDEKNIINKALMKLFPVIKKEQIEEIVLLAEEKEKISNQIIEYTRELKKYKVDFRLKIIEILWKIIYSDEKADMYETNLMRRLTGLLYLSDKEVGEIKKKILINGDHQ